MSDKKSDLLNPYTEDVLAKSHQSLQSIVVSKNS